MTPGNTVRYGSIVALATLSAIACRAPESSPTAAAPGQPPATGDAARVAVVMNDQSPESREIANYYVERRSVPQQRVIHISVTPRDEVSDREYRVLIEAEAKRQLAGMNPPPDFLVTTKGVPIRISEGGYSVDAMLAAHELDVKPMSQPSPEERSRCTNPYFKAVEPFSHSRHKLYLVTRLDGYTVADGKRLVDDALAAKPEKGLFFCDQRAWNPSGIDLELENGLAKAVSSLSKSGFEATLENTIEFGEPKEPLMGYWSSGSNDRRFSPEAYHALKFAKGGIAETNVSTSARTFQRVTGGQSMIADLIEQGAAGAKGYVSEPYEFALARPEILFDRYTKGFTLAESFYAASPLIKWKDLVIGDPLCCPYKTK